MTLRDQVLSFVAASEPPTDTIRLMIGLFLFTQDVKAGDLPPQAETFEFEPMSYGPCAMSVYTVLAALRADVLVIESPVTGEAWSRYQITGKGLHRADGIVAQTQNALMVSRLRTLRYWCDRQSLSSMLKSTNHAFPEYAPRAILPSLSPHG